MWKVSLGWGLARTRPRCSGRTGFALQYVMLSFLSYWRVHPGRRAGQDDELDGRCAGGGGDRRAGRRACRSWRCSARAGRSAGRNLGSPCSPMSTEMILTYRCPESRHCLVAEVSHRQLQQNTNKTSIFLNFRKATNSFFRLVQISKNVTFLPRLRKIALHCNFLR